MNSDLLYIIALSLIKNIGPVNARNLMNHCGGDAKSVFNSSAGKWQRTPGIGPGIIARLKSTNALKAAEREINYCEKASIDIFHFEDPSYPKALSYIHDSPLIIYKKGNIDLNGQPAIGIVGTRKASAYGREITELFASHFAQMGINVVSGLAYGIDIQAHKAALERKGKTTAVLGHGFNYLYPSVHKSVASSMLAQGGILTEYTSDTGPEAGHFPSRNRIISGICKAIIVVEAGIRGGALITAKQAFDQNREVYAIPGRIGDIYSAGCNRLIRDNIAKAATDPQEVLEDLQIKWSATVGEHSANNQLTLALSKKKSASENPMETQILNFLKNKSFIVDQISKSTGIPLEKLNHILLSMEFKGLLSQEPGKRYKRRSLVG